VGVAFIRGLARDRAGTLGNFWVDLVRSILWVLLPLSIVGALVLVWQGVPMNFQAYTQATGTRNRAALVRLRGAQAVAPQDRKEIGHSRKCKHALIGCVSRK
jgi:K+-transporting ATPase A subunit